ncbi:NAD(P)H-hydrate dehydratase [Gammaproteobacteria bacterium LSUCC0057]|uniref:Bifunctional NAD(P)H-hydrate repair enzyme n=1 Tax=Gammaproteobacteria bacterium LSUCC0057 TaxID=2559237 RepID=A0A4Y8UGD6_9GAMM|nr:NAD(P)H-hydrate dehydratase [Gammaproteobacteria bacterium LSUCC0057]
MSQLRQETLDGSLPLSSRLYDAAGVAQIDAAAQAAGQSSEQLMSLAARAALAELEDEFGRDLPLLVACGGGNNGGDGFALAALAASRGRAVHLFELAEPSRLSATAAAARKFAQQSGVVFVDTASELLDDREGVVVDALLGIGASGAVRQEYAAVIELINASGLPVVALDLPSGLCATTGRGDCAVVADLTVTFIAAKLGLFTGRGVALAGEVVLHSLDLDEALYTAPVAAQLIDVDEARERLPLRDRNGHKGLYGHVLIVGGDFGGGGAVALAAEAALRSGAGLVSVATRPEHVAAVLARSPEAMVYGVTSGQDLEPLLTRPSVIVVGPGLGQSAWSEQLLQQVLKTQLPLLLDADALNILAAGRLQLRRSLSNSVITPHPGEAARLLGSSSSAVQADRPAAVRQLQALWGSAVVLKGAGTLVAADNDLLGLCAEGNPGMASAGMGDLLSGIIGALLAQQLSGGDAARLGVALHATAADRAVSSCGERSLLASDLLAPLIELLAV